MVTLKRIGVLSMAKLEAVILAIMGLLQGLFFAVFGALLGAAGDMASFGIGAGFGLLAIIFLPIIYGIMGFIMGAIGAFVYNIIAGAVGGIEVEFSE